MQSFTKSNETTKTFDEECKVIDLRKEYGTAFVGDTPIAIVSELSAEQIRESFPKEIESYPSFTLLTPAVFEVFRECHKEDQKVRAQSIAHPSVPLELAELVLIDPLGDIPSICESCIALESIIEKMLNLPEHQGSRLYKRYILGFTPAEIAAEESVTRIAVWHSLQDGKKAIREVFNEFGGVA